ncbi:L-threonylcarbamoyladenylate synthase [Polaromonas jejuensis]|uniref:Threonylcarbamoyl-AMP synthase n=1 Tax=Polaromonas jejuensis TaxID=457502 RepID=A0ABW0QHG8_9BURK|nr:Sua5/YciO/YrdC/YwlC family protein [Polaromonas jejuensis]
MTSTISSSDPDDIAQALREGGVVAYPTEAVFGLGCDPQNAKAVACIHQIKQRSADQGFLLVGAEFRHVEAFIDIKRVPSAVLARAKSSWPGPTTWIFPASSIVPKWVMGRHSGIALRVTAHAPAAALCRAFDGALVSTSANPHGEPPARTLQEALRYFPVELAAAMDAEVGAALRPTPIMDALTGKVVRE